MTCHINFRGQNEDHFGSNMQPDYDNEKSGMFRVVPVDLSGVT